MIIEGGAAHLARVELKLSDRETQSQGKHEFPVFGQRWTEMTA
ncbi:hypothetical protein [Burkholderia stagnalis]|nr:hypothetical protein [Burkholderia stagnalis]